MADPYDGFDYHEYLKSDAWAERRRLVIERDKTCRSCETARIEDVHHLSYVLIGQEPLVHLLGLCHRCHQIIHGHTPDLLELRVGKKKKKKDKEAISEVPAQATGQG